MLEEYAEQRTRAPGVAREHVEEFHRLWLSFDRRRTGFVHVAHLPFLLRALPPPLGPFGEARREDDERRWARESGEEAAAAATTTAAAAAKGEDAAEARLRAEEEEAHRCLEGAALSKLETVYLTVTAGQCVYYGDLLQSLLGFAHDVDLLSIPEKARARGGGWWCGWGVGTHRASGGN